MGWGDCGFNKKIGKWMGYSQEGVCAHPGCTKTIDHGLSYVCGGMHEGGDCGCGDYFCSEHLTYFEDEPTDKLHQVCFACCKWLEENSKSEDED